MRDPRHVRRTYEEVCQTSPVLGPGVYHSPRSHARRAGSPDAADRSFWGDMSHRSSSSVRSTPRGASLASPPPKTAGGRTLSPNGRYRLEQRRHNFPGSISHYLTVVKEMKKTWATPPTTA